MLYWVALLSILCFQGTAHPPGNSDPVLRGQVCLHLQPDHVRSLPPQIQRGSGREVPLLGGARAGQSRPTSFVNRHKSKQQSPSSMPGTSGPLRRAISCTLLDCATFLEKLILWASKPGVPPLIMTKIWVFFAVFTAHLYPSYQPCSLQPNKAQIEFTQSAWVAWFHWTSLAMGGEINFHILDGILLHQIPATPNSNNNAKQMLKTYVDRESMINISAGRNNGSTVRCIFQLCNKYVLLNTLNHSPLTLKTTWSTVPEAFSKA